jgi:hypothetical protein
MEVNNALNILKPKNLIICMDSNAKSKVLFNKSDNNRGQSLIDFINQNNLFIINNNDNSQLTTYFTTTGVSNIDLTIIDLNSIQFVNNWRICDDLNSMSDHQYLEFDICESLQTIKYKNTRKYIIRDENWADFEHKCEVLVNTLRPLIDGISNENELNYFINQLSLKLNDICDECFRTKNYNKTINNKTNNWWTQDLTCKRREMNRIRRAYQRCQTPNRMQIKYNYLSAREEYKQLLISTKIKSWKSYIENNSKGNPWGLIYAIIKDKIKVEKVSELRRSDGSIITDTNEIANELLDTLFPDDNIQTDTDFHKMLRQKQNDNYNEPNDIFFTEIEATEVINTQNKSKAPGIDGFTADIIKNLHSIDNTFMTDIYNKFLSIGLFPNIWKISCVKVLKKPNKQDYTTAKSYRPISLLSVFSKILEKLWVRHDLHTHDLHT